MVLGRPIGLDGREPGKPASHSHGFRDHSPTPKSVDSDLLVHLLGMKALWYEKKEKKRKKEGGGEILRRCALWWENLNPYLVWYLGSFPGWSACQSHGQLTLQSSKVRSCSGSHMDITHIKWVRRWYILWRVIKKKTSSSPPPPPPVFRRPNPDAVLSGNPNSLFPLRENLKVGKVILLLLNAYFILFFCRLRLSSIRDLIRIESRDVAWNKLIAISYQASAGQNLQ